MKTCTTNSSVCSDKKLECMCTWKYTYFPQLGEWNDNYAQFTIYFPGLGNCAESGCWRIATSNDLIYQCLVKVWKGQAHNTNCYTGIKWDDDFDYMNTGEFEYITYHYTDEERKHFFTNNCIVIGE